MITQTPSISSVELAEALNKQIRHSLGKTSPPIWSTYRREGGHYQLKISWPKSGASFPSTNLGIKEVRRLGKEEPLSLYLGDHSSGVHAYLPFHQVSSLLIGGGEHVEQNVGLDIVLTNLVYQASPKNLRLLIVDPMSETSPFHGLPHLYSPILDEEECISEAFNWLSIESRRRLSQLSRIGAQSFAEYIDQSIEKWMRVVLVIPDLQSLNPQQRLHLATCLEKIERSPHDLGLHIIINTRGLDQVRLPRGIVDHVKTKLILSTSGPKESEFVNVEGAEWLLNQHDMLLQVSNGVHRIHGWQFSHASFIRVLNVFAASVPVEYISQDRVFIQTVGGSAQSRLRPGRPAAKTPKTLGKNTRAKASANS
jgi:DNA segregation ATPase FtsK/SpoIIIE-like protein